MEKRPKLEVVVEKSPEAKNEGPKIGWKRIAIGLAVVLIGNLYSYFTAYSKGILFNGDTIVGLLAIIIGMYIILK